MKLNIISKIAIAGLTTLTVVGLVKYDIASIAIETVTVAKERVESRKLEKEPLTVHVEEPKEEPKEEIKNPNNVTDVDANIIVDYMEGIYNITATPTQEIEDYLSKWLMTDSVAYEFYKTNGEKLTTAEGESIIKNIKIKSADPLISEEGLLQVRTTESWIFANGDEKEFNNDYAIKKTESKPVIQEIKMDELKDYITNYK